MTKATMAWSMRSGRSSLPRDGDPAPRRTRTRHRARVRAVNTMHDYDAIVTATVLSLLILDIPARGDASADLCVGSRYMAGGVATMG